MPPSSGARRPERPSCPRPPRSIARTFCSWCCSVSDRASFTAPCRSSSSPFEVCSSPPRGGLLLTAAWRFAPHRRSRLISTDLDRSRLISLISPSRGDGTMRPRAGARTFRRSPRSCGISTARARIRSAARTSCAPTRRPSSTPTLRAPQRSRRGDGVGCGHRRDAGGRLLP